MANTLVYWAIVPITVTKVYGLVPDRFVLQSRSKTRFPVTSLLQLERKKMIGATPYSIITLNRMTLFITTLNVNGLCIAEINLRANSTNTFSRMTLSIMTLSVNVLGITALNLMTLTAT